MSLISPTDDLGMSYRLDAHLYTSMSYLPQMIAVVCLLLLYCQTSLTTEPKSWGFCPFPFYLKREEDKLPKHCNFIEIQMSKKKKKTLSQIIT
jgi:hypothetical protein